MKLKALIAAAFLLVGLSAANAQQVPANQFWASPASGGSNLPAWRPLVAGDLNTILVPLTNGGTAASLVASNGGVVYSGSSAFAVLAGTATAGQCLLSGSNAAPTWGTCTGGSTGVATANNADSTLTLTGTGGGPFTGNVTFKINLANPNTWTGLTTINSISTAADTLSVVTANDCCGNNGIGITGATDGVSLMIKNTASGGNDWRIISSDTASTAPGLRFFDFTNTTDALFLANTGKVGLGGVFSPVNQLDVGGSNAGIHLASNSGCTTTLSLCNNGVNLTWNGNELSACVSAPMVGFIAGGNNHTAWTNWFSSLGGGSGCVAFPPGTFDDATGNDSYTMTSGAVGVRILGSGVNVTKLTWSNGGGMTINYFDLTDAFELGGFYYANGTTSGTGLTLQVTPGNSITAGSAARTTIHDMFFVGASCSISAGHWDTAITIHTTPNVEFRNVSICGTGAANMAGVHIDGSTQTLTTNGSTTGSNLLHFASVPNTVTVGMGCWDQNNINAIAGNGFGPNNSVQATSSATITLGANVAGTVNSGDVIQCANDNANYHFTNVSFVDASPAIDIGTGTQGVTIDGNTSSGAIGLSAAAFFQTAANVFGLDGLIITGSEIASGNTYCIISDSEWTDFNISNNIMYCSPGAADGVFMGPSARGTIVGNNIIASGSNTGSGIHVQGPFGTIDNNVIQGWLDGITLDGSSSHWVVGTGNSFSVSNVAINNGGGTNTIPLNCNPLTGSAVSVFGEITHC